MNIELLLKVKAAILASPREFDMTDWRGYCGTTACIGGWAKIIALNLDHPGNATFMDCVFAPEVELGLDYEQSGRLFYDSEWPEVFRDRYGNAEGEDNHYEMAQAAADRIDHFIATGGAE